MRFVDTNVLLYRISRDPAERAKVAIAAEILASPDLALSVQVLQEFYVQATRAGSRARVTHEDAARLVDAWARFPVAEITLGVLRAALATRERFQISYWDAAIIEAARTLRCEVVLSEDLSHGQDYGGVVVEDPFRG